ncbi:expressed unknown protein [Seminavis robusta]|uniref:Uncharacterized protein n=1 Tax=Seminavis robusta TaxID=568900 RepID=A0A9N8HKN2_9STRA|nr:expressed unknown protein [Seminavis robusta]|eukprot:Sro767_g199540.1 n/a (311) ;mRNA; r:41622-42751
MMIISWINRFALWVLLILFFSPCCCLGQETNTEQPPPPSGKLSVEELEALTDQELELICLERGFELIRDGSEGDLTHDDYVEAARRCLAIEEDMNEILEQNPELAEELLSELDRMKDEKELLEQQVAQQEAERDRLEQEVAEATAKSDKQAPRMWGDGTAYSQYQQQQQSATGPASSTPVSGSGSNSQQSTETAKDSSSSSSSTEEPDMCGNPTTTEVDDKEQQPATDFSLKTFVQEVIAEFEKDARRFTTLIFPVVKPLFSAGNFAWRHLKVLFHGAKEQLKKYKESSSDSSNNKEAQAQATSTTATKT